MMKTCFDVNVLLEVLLRGRKKSNVASTILSRTQQAYISPLSAHIYVHFGKKENHNIADLLEDLQNYKITDMGEPAVRWAIRNRQDDDFEDALQIACAVLEGCGKFVTFDANLSKKYSHFIDIHLLS